MPFRFPLQSVFHFRQSVEHQQEMSLRAANQKVAHVRRLLEQLDHCLQQEHLQHQAELCRGTNAASLHFALIRSTSLQETREALERELKRLQNLRDQQQRTFWHARQEREVIETLRERQLGEYKRDTAKRQQRLLDDLFLLRQAYTRRG